MRDHFLGIDLGTTSLSLTVTDPAGEIFLCKTVPHGCAVAVEGLPDAFAIDPVRLISLANDAGGDDNITLIAIEFADED